MVAWTGSSVVATFFLFFLCLRDGVDGSDWVLVTWDLVSSVSESIATQKRENLRFQYLERAIRFSERGFW